MANLAQIIPALFVGPGGQQLTQEQIRERQQMAQDLLAQATDTSPNAGGVASVLAKGVAGFRAGMDRNSADNALKANAGTNQSLIAGLLGGLGGTGGLGQTATAATPTVAPMQNVAPATNWDASTVPDTLKSGIQDTATALGVDPIDLATAISYETAGTFDPTKTGPTTQWGQHRGLIQFGEPQAQKYGVDWNNPIGSQLGANGAVANYLRDTGVQPGMGLLDIYSAINAGGVGRYNRSDANNGGAPGTVRDKVEQQMADHRSKAVALFGGQTAAPSDNGIEAALASSTRSSFPPAPSAQSASSGANPAIIAALSSPVANEQTRSVATALLNNQLSQQQAAQDRAMTRDNWLFQQDYQAQQQANDPLRQLQIQKAQRELAQGPNADENFYGNPVAVQNPDGSIAYGQIGNRGTFKPIQLGEGQSFAPPTRTIDAGTETIMVDQAGNVISRTPKNNRVAAAETAGGTVEGRVAAERATSASGDIQAGQNALDILGQIEKHPGLDLGTGATSLANRVPGTTGYDFQNIVEQAKSGAFLAAIQQMRGLGALSNTEGAAATSAVTRMDTATSKDAFLKALSDYRKIVQQGIDRAKTNSKAPVESETTPQPAQKRLKFNPATGMLE